VKETVDEQKEYQMEVTAPIDLNLSDIAVSVQSLVGRYRQ
jgi:hypothetical protein